MGIVRPPGRNRRETTASHRPRHTARGTRSGDRYRYCGDRKLRTGREGDRSCAREEAEGQCARLRRDQHGQEHEVRKLHQGWTERRPAPVRASEVAGREGAGILQGIRRALGHRGRPDRAREDRHPQGERRDAPDLQAGVQERSGVRRPRPRSPRRRQRPDGDQRRLRSRARPRHEPRRFSAAQAAARAIATVVADPPTDNLGNEASTDGLTAASTELLVYRMGLVRNVPGSNQLVYEVEVTNGADVREFVFVHAQRREDREPLLRRPERSVPTALRGGPRPPGLAGRQPLPREPERRSATHRDLQRAGLLPLPQRVRPGLLRRPRSRDAVRQQRPPHQLSERQLERRDDELLHRRDRRRCGRARVGPRLHGVHRTA